MILQAKHILHERYLLKQQLGNNAGRQTWLAVDLGTQSREQVIVKLLPFSPQIHWDDLKLFEREAQVLKYLHHLQIPKYRDYFSTEPSNSDDLPWFGLVQDYIPGYSLQQLLKKGKRFTQAEVKEIAIQLLKILIYLHELSPSVLHRDIKPSNIIWGKNRQVYLVDFGAVQERAKAEGATFTVVGTGGYAPPEQLWGRAVAASDLYALGATLIHLLTGTAPVNLPQREMRLQFRDQVSLSASFAHWLETLIEPAPELRFSNARKALEALQANGSPSPLEAAYTDTQETTPQNRQRVVNIAIAQYIIAFLCVIALPSILGMVWKAKQAEGKQNIGAMNRAQQAYFLEYQKFSDSLQDLGVGIKPQTENYDYSIRATPFAVIHYATPRNKMLKGYVAVFFPIVHLDNQMHCEDLTGGIACETQFPGTTRPAAPIVTDNFVICAPNTKLINDYKPMPIIKMRSPNREYINDDNWYAIDNDTALAYKALAYTTAGEYDKALEVAKTIKDDSSKQRALDAIARYQKSP